MGHAEWINPLGVKLGVEVSFAHISSKLSLDRICNQVSNLFDGHQARRPIVLELTSLLWVHLFIRRFTLDERLLLILTSLSFFLWVVRLAACNAPTPNYLIKPI